MHLRRVLGFLLAILVISIESFAIAGEVVAIRGGTWVGFVFTDKEIAKKLTKQDLFFLGLHLRKSVFERFDPLAQAEERTPVIVQESTGTGAAELDRVINELGRLIREMKAKGNSSP